MASFLTYTRACSIWQPATCLEAAPALGALCTALAATVIVLGSDEPSVLFRGLQPTFWIALLLSALGSAIYDSALVIAPRSLTSEPIKLMSEPRT